MRSLLPSGARGGKAGALDLILGPLAPGIVQLLARAAREHVNRPVRLWLSGMAWDLPSPLHAGEHWTAHRWVSNGGMGANCCGTET